MITVYSKSRCIQCVYTKKELDKLGLTYDEINVEKYPGMADVLRDKGFTAMPIVDPGNGAEWWSGFRPERIRALKQSKQTEE